MTIFTVNELTFLKDGSVISSLENTDNYQDALKLFDECKDEMTQMAPNAICLESTAPEADPNTIEKYEKVATFKPDMKPGRPLAVIYLYARELEPSNNN